MARFIIHERIRNPRDLLEAIGFDAQQFCAKSFRNQGLYKLNQWKARSVPSLAGIFADANKPGGDIKTRRLDPRPALIDTGLLARSISYRVISDRIVLVGTNVPYAKVHNEGGYSTQVKSNTKANFDKKIDKFVKNSMGSFDSKTKGMVLSLKHADSLTTRVPKRQFLGYPIKRANKIIKDVLLGGP